MDDDLKAIKQTIPFGLPLHNALMAEAATLRREFTEHVQHLLYEHAIEKGFLVGEDVLRIKLFWELVDDVKEAAKDLCRAGKFARSITKDAIDICLRNDGWVAKYKQYVKDDIFKHGNPLKGHINREIGARVRQGIGGEVELGADGKAINVKVVGSIIQSYTPMSDYDPKAVE